MNQEDINRLRELIPTDHPGEWNVFDHAAYYTAAVHSLPTLIAEAERAKLLEDALEPFKIFSDTLETQGLRGTWVGTELDDYRAEISVPKDLPDDLVVMSVQVELPGGQLSCPLYVEDFRRARTELERNQRGSET